MREILFTLCTQLNKEKNIISIILIKNKHVCDIKGDRGKLYTPRSLGEMNIDINKQTYIN